MQRLRSQYGTIANADLAPVNFGQGHCGEAGYPGTIKMSLSQVLQMLLRSLSVHRLYLFRIFFAKDMKTIRAEGHSALYNIGVYGQSFRRFTMKCMEVQNITNLTC